MKSKYVKIFSRPHNIQRMLSMFQGSLKYSSIKGVGIGNLIVTKFENIYDYYMPEKEWNGFLRKTGNYVLKQDIKKHEIIFHHEMDKYIGTAEIFKKPGYQIRTINNQELSLLFGKIIEGETIFSKYAFIPWAIDLHLFPILENKLRKINKDKYLKWLEIIAEPTKRSALSRYQLELLKTKTSGEITNKKIENLHKKYSWLPVYDYMDKPWREKDMHYQLKKIKNAKAILKDNINSFKRRSNNYQRVLGKIKPDEKLKSLIDLIHDYTFLRDERADAWRKEAFFRIEFYKEAARRFKLNILDVINLKNEEIFGLLENGQIGNLGDIRKRKLEHLVLIQNRRLKIIVNKSEIAGIKGKYLTLNFSQKELKGFSAFKGKATGRARVVTDQKKLKEFKTGEVLVAHHTGPAYIFAMKESAAIVTDEGGITSHAAIVSREFRIPCVTATQMASKIIKTGDLIEVDANKGTVRILSKI